jgi:hypothetical protein
MIVSPPSNLIMDSQNLDLALQRMSYSFGLHQHPSRRTKITSGSRSTSSGGLSLRLPGACPAPIAQGETSVVWILHTWQAIGLLKDIQGLRAPWTH